MLATECFGTTGRRGLPEWKSELLAADPIQWLSNNHEISFSPLQCTRLQLSSIQRQTCASTRCHTPRAEGTAILEIYPKAGSIFSKSWFFEKLQFVLWDWFRIFETVSEINTLWIFDKQHSPLSLSDLIISKFMLDKILMSKFHNFIWKCFISLRDSLTKFVVLRKRHS